METEERRQLLSLNTLPVQRVLGLTVAKFTMSSFPFVEVLSYETGLPVTVSVWHIRSVRPPREAAVDDDTVTRIEYMNGDFPDVSDSVETVRGRIETAIQPVFRLACGGRIIAVMSKTPLREERANGLASDRFEQMAKARFRVEQRYVPKHGPKKLRKPSVLNTKP